jgi:hypothetical protein
MGSGGGGTGDGCVGTGPGIGPVGTGNDGCSGGMGTSGGTSGVSGPILVIEGLVATEDRPFLPNTVIGDLTGR